ncbi:MAG: hypothetical protein U0807_01825 [Candidatus Binatia bacterium]
MSDHGRPSLRVLGILGALASLTVGASIALAGPFTGKGTQPGLTYSLLKASTCQGCHGDYDSAHDIEPWPTWAGSMMAQASRDPLFWAALDVANNDVPGVGEWCLRCHVPDGWLAGRSEPPGGTDDGCGLLGEVDDRNSDFEGVACHFCHRMMHNPAPPPGQSAFYLENAQFWLDDTNCAGQGEPCRRAQFDYPSGGPDTPPPHAWAPSAYHESSDLCGNCHNVTNPALDLLVGGIDQGIRFPIERTYREWLLSDFASAGPDFAACQSCHVPDTTLDPVYACAFQTNNRAADMGVHQFAGGNAWVPEVLRLTYPALGLDTELTATRAAALDLLQNRSATVEILPPAFAPPGGTANVSVTVTNRTGHKLPTGYPEGRRMWLHVEARDATNALVWESGAYDGATGVLTRDPQAKVYEAKQGVWNVGTSRCEVDGGGMDLFHFAKNDCVALDNRIPPQGFLGGADVETAPVGHVYPEASPGKLANWDVTSYAIPIPGTAVSPLTIRATLRYQTTSKEYVDFLDDQATTHGFPNDCLDRSTGPLGKTRARFLKDLWTTHGRAAPVDLGVATGTTQVRAVDPFACYKAGPSKGSTKFVAPAGGLGLANAYDTATFDVKKPRDLCAPADDGTGRVDAATHLEAYPVKLAAGQPVHVPRTTLTVTDQFGPLTLETVKAETLLVPAAKDLSAPPALPGPNEVDVFTCYKVKLSKGAPKFPKGRQITLADQFTSPPAVLDLKKPRSLCLPTGVDGGGTKHAAARLLCYQAKSAVGTVPHTPRTGVYLNNAVLGAGQVDTKKTDLVCLPATVAP